MRRITLKLLVATALTFPTGLVVAETIKMTCTDEKVPLRYTSAWKNLFSPTFEAQVGGEWVDLCGYMIGRHKSRRKGFHLYRCETSGNEDALFTFKAYPIDLSEGDIDYIDFRNTQGQIFRGIFSVRFACKPTE